MWLANLGYSSLSENAQQQFYTIVENCKYMLGSNNKWKKRINLPDVLNKHFYNLCYSLQESNDLSQASLLQQWIISAFLLLEEWYDFSQHRDNLEAMWKVIAKRWRQEGGEEDWNRLFLDAAESLRTDWQQPPHKDMVRATDFFRDLAQQKLNADQSELDEKLAETHMKTPWFLKAWPYGTVYIEKQNFKTDIDKQYRVEQWEIEWIRVKKWYDKIGWDLSVIEILEGPYAWEQLFSDQWMSNGFKRDILDENQELYHLPNNSEEHAQDIELFRSTLHSLVNIYPGYIQLDKNWNLKFHEQWETSKYWWNLGCTYSLVSQKWKSEIYTEESEDWNEFRKFERNTFYSVRAIHKTPYRNKYSYE